MNVAIGTAATQNTAQGLPILAAKLQTENATVVQRLTINVKEA